MRAAFDIEKGLPAPDGHPEQAEYFYNWEARMVHRWLDRAHEFYRASMALLEKLLEEDTQRHGSLKWLAGRQEMEQPGSPPREIQVRDAFWSVLPRVDTATFVLMGYCMEHLIKGLLAGDSSCVMTSNGKLAGDIKHHDLNKLLKKTGVSCSSSQEEFLRFLTPFASGDARYPITTSAETSIRGISYPPGRIADEFHGLYLLFGSELVRRDRFFGKPGTIVGVGAEEAAWTGDEWIQYRLFGIVPDRVVRASLESASS